MLFIHTTVIVVFFVFVVVAVIAIHRPMHINVDVVFGLLFNLFVYYSRLKVAAEASSSGDESPDELETEEERAKRKEFEKRRKAHYNEYKAVQLARKLMEEEEEEVEDGLNTKSKLPKMDVEPSGDQSSGSASGGGGGSGSGEQAGEDVV